MRIGDDRRATCAGIVISPGPCTPHEAGVSLDLVQGACRAACRSSASASAINASARPSAGSVTRAKRPLHGEASAIRHDGAGRARRLPDGFSAGRYHSLIVELDDDTSPLDVTARTEDGEIMGLEHRAHPTFGVQFHPELVLTEHGYDILRNFLTYTA